MQNSDLPEEDSVPEVRDNSQVLVIKINDYFYDMIIIVFNNRRDLIFKYSKD